MDTLVSRNEIPILDLQNEDSISALEELWVKKAADQLYQALTNHGLVFLVNHGIPREKLQKAYEVMDKFCELPDDKKAQYKIDPSNYNQGYAPPGVERFTEDKQKEARHSFNIQRFYKKLPNNEVPGFKEALLAASEEFKRVATVLLHITAVSLDFQPGKFVSAHKGMLEDGNGSTFRVIYYPPLGEEPFPDTTRCGEHTDYGTFTLLAQDSEGGLEVVSGGQWRRVGYLADALLVNTGDLMEKWTLGTYKALKHRVVVPNNSTVRTQGRHSIAFFVHPSYSTVIDPKAFSIFESESTTVEEKTTAYQHLETRLKETFEWDAQKSQI